MRKAILTGKKLLSFTAALFLLLFMSTMATAKATSSDAQLKKDIAAIDREATTTQQKQIVTDRMAKEFKVSAGDVKAFSGKLRGLGETAAIYAFADKMPGGVSTANLDKVVSERKSKKDWDDIAEMHQIKLSSISDKVHSFYKDVHKDIKEASAGKMKGAAAGGSKGGKTTGKY